MNTTRKLFGILNFALIGLIFVCQTSYAAGVAGQVQFAFGNVQVTTAAGDTHALKKGDSVNEGDTVFTAISSSAQIKMKDGGFIAIRPDTNMKFDKFVFNGTQDGEEKGFFSLFKGGFRAVTGLVGKVNKQNYKIFTKAATVGIRGTDHEVFFVPEGNPLAPSGAYSKVNVGETTLTTSRGTVNVLPNQMGFASGMNVVPKVVPINTQLFTVAAAPTKTVKERKAEQSKQAGASSQGDKQSGGQGNSQGGKQEASAANGNAGEGTAANTSSGSNSGTGAASSSGSNANTGDSTTIRVASSDSAPLLSSNSVTMLGGSTPMPMQLGQATLSVPQLLVPIILTNATTGGTLNSSSLTYTVGGAATTLTGGTSIVSLAYAANHVAVESTNFNTWGSLVSPADLVYVAGGSSSSGALSAYTELNIGGGSNWTYSASITGGKANSFNAPSFVSTGIQYGYWTGYTSQTFTNTYTLGGTNGGSSIWMYGPQGYIDSAYLTGTAVSSTSPMYGTFNYQMDGGNSPKYQNSGVVGTLTSASISANFTTMKVSASLGLTMPGSDDWGANVSNLAISAAGGGAFYGYASPGGAANTMTVTHGVGTATTCSTCSGNLSGMFTGQNFSGAMISYQLSDTAQGGTVSGDAALTRNVTGNATVTNNAAAPTGQIVIDNGYGSLGTYSSGSVVTSGNVLTQYGSSSTNLVTVSCPTCGATASTNATTTNVSSGIYYGTWTSGTYSSTYGSSTATNGAASTAPAYWITGPEAGPLYLPQALVGKASYALDAGQVTNSAGVTGAVKGTTALSVNFTNQTVGANLDASISGHTWNASTVTAAPLMGNQGIGGAAFHFTTSSANTGNGNYNGYGTLNVTVDGVSGTSNWGYIDGQLTGTGLTGAIVSFNLYGSNSTGYSDSLNGVAAFTGTAQSTSTPYQSILASTYDTVALVPTLGFYANNSSRVTQDTSGNLTKFDSQSVASGGSNSSVTLTNVGSTLTDHGTDPVTGISWGRWSGGTLNVTNRATGTVTATALTGSLHWIAEPVATTAVTLPISGTYTYTYAGGTKPTDNLGNVGTLNSATLSANFTAQTVNLGVNTTVNGGTLNATGTNAPIIQNTVFYASSQEPSSSSSSLKVTCTGTCGTTTGGTVIGKFTGAGATGVAMSYGLQNGSSVVNGVAAFHR